MNKPVNIGHRVQTSKTLMSSWDMMQELAGPHKSDLKNAVSKNCMFGLIKKESWPGHI